MLPIETSTNTDMPLMFENSKKIRNDKKYFAVQEDFFVVKPLLLLYCIMQMNRQGGDLYP